jgi:tetratricopeptide (TPR) repeat protein
MSRVTSLTNMPEAQLNRWIKRLALLFVVVLIAFVAFYVIDRFRAPTASIADQSLVALEEAVRTEPANIANRGKLADTYLAKGRYEEAVAQYSAIIETGKDVELASYQRAQAYIALAQYDPAIADLNKVIEIASPGEMANVDPLLQGAFYSLGDIALRQDRAADAVGFLEKALAIKKADADSLLLIGRAYAATGETEKGGEAFRKAVAFVPIGWAEPYQAMADMYTAAGQAELAAWANAMVAFQTGSPQQAIEQLTPLVDGPAGLDANVGLGIIAETEGRLADARGFYAAALAIDDTNVTAQMGLGRVGPAATPAPSALPSLPAPGATDGGTGS